MKRKEALSKLRSLEAAVDSHLSDEYKWLYLNPKFGHAFFDQFIPMRDDLGRQWPSLFDNLPVHPKPICVDRCGDDEPFFKRVDIIVLLDDIRQYADQLEANPDKQTWAEKAATASLVFLAIALVAANEYRGLPRTVAIAIGVGAVLLVGIWFDLFSLRAIVRRVLAWASKLAGKD